MMSYKTLWINEPTVSWPKNLASISIPISININQFQTICSYNLLRRLVYRWETFWSLLHGSNNAPHPPFKPIATADSTSINNCCLFTHSGPSKIWTHSFFSLLREFVLFVPKTNKERWLHKHRIKLEKELRLVKKSTVFIR